MFKKVSALSTRKDFLSKAGKIIGALAFGGLETLAQIGCGGADSVEEQGLNTPSGPEPFITNNAELENIRQAFIQDGELQFSKIKPKLIDTWDNAVKNYFNLVVINGKPCAFIQDPSQNNEMVSEGLGFWLRIASLMATIDSDRKYVYQAYFDQLLNGVNAAIKLAQDSGNAGEFMAWAFKINGSALELDTTKSGPANSAADADLDVARAVLQAKKNVTTGLWNDNNYDDYLALYAPKMKNLFKTVNALNVLNPSEDWTGFHFIDYGRSALFAELSEDYGENSNTVEENYWRQAAKDTMQVYYEALADTANIPAQAYITAGTNYLVDLKIEQIAAQSWDGIRGPFNIAEALLRINANDNFKELLNVYLETRDDKTYTDSALDAAMYMVLALAAGKLNLARNIRDNLVAKMSDKLVYNDMSRYYQTTLIFLALLFIYTPIKDINKIEMYELPRNRSIGSMVRRFNVQADNNRSTDVPNMDYSDRWSLRQGN